MTRLFKTNKIDLQNELDKERTKEFGLIQIIEYARIGFTKGIKQILNNNKEMVNIRDSSGATAALVAAEQNDVETLKLLINNGADLTIPDLDGVTVIDWAKKHNNQDMMDLIAENTTSYSSYSL